MKRAFLLLTLISTFSAGIASAQQSCMMTLEQERQMILSEGPKALQSQGSECFERLVKTQIDMMKDSRTNLERLRSAVIQDLMASAMKGEIFENDPRE